MTLWYLVISLPLLPVYLTFLACLIFYKKIIFTILRFKYDSNLSPIGNIDSFFTLGKFEENFSYILTTMNTTIKEKDLEKKIVEALYVKIIQNHKHFKKCLSSLHIFMGYPFLIKEESEAADFVKVVDVKMNHYESINHLAYEYSIKPLPRQNKSLFEIIILKCSTEWKVKNDLKEEQIPVLIRVHHCLGDGLSIMNLIVQLFGDNKLVIDEVIDKFNSKNELSQFWKRLFENIYLFLVFPGYVALTEMKILSNRRLSLSILGSGKQHFAFKVGDEMLLDKIKEFKKKIGDLSFSEILLTSISASLYDYFEKKNGEVPLTIGALVPAVRNLEEVNKNGLPILTNQFGIASFEIPIKIGSQSMYKRIRNVKEYTRAPDIIINFLILRYQIGNLFGLFPSCIKKLFFRSKYTSVILSFLPGFQKITCFNGIKMDNTFFFLISRENMGIGFSMITYDNKLHLGVKAYENIISSQADCQLLADNVFKRLNELIMESSYENINNSK